FIEPVQAIRDFGVKVKLNPVRELLEGRRVVLVDDSIVRGTTSRKIVRMVREAGATEVHVRISCPPTISPCYYGIDTPTREELIASANSIDQIREFLAADSLGYLSLDNLRRAVGDAGVPFTGWHVRLWREPHRQQVVIFRAPLPGTPDYVKRVIGLPGDTLEIHRGVVWVNGQPLAERYLNEPPNPRENLTAVKVPPESYFVMGDNRENSYDSRFWGFVPRSAIVGTPLVIYMSLQAPEGAWDAGQIHERLYAYLNAVAHPRLVRWKRLFTTF